MQGNDFHSAIVSEKAGGILMEVWTPECSASGSTMNSGTPAVSKARTGIPGLDDILYGGLTRGQLFLTEGNPGTGKTTLGLQFILEGARAGEKGLYITLTETEQELREVVA